MMLNQHIKESNKKRNITTMRLLRLRIGNAYLEVALPNMTIEAWQDVPTPQ
jgi:hypothetical protein